MVSKEDHPVDRAVSRVFGGVVGLVLGILAGVVVAILTWGTLDFVLTAGGIAVGMTTLGAVFPTPFQFLGGLVVGMLSDLA
jgi:hypothetical protein